MCPSPDLPTRLPQIRPTSPSFSRTPSPSLQALTPLHSLPPLLAPPPTFNSTTTQTTHSDLPTQITYRHYATLYFILISTSTESPLALLDLIQVFVEALDRLFNNVCELDLIFNFEAMHACLAEMVVGGVVVETRVGEVVKGVRESGKGSVSVRGKEQGGFSLAGGLGGGRGMWAGR